MGALLLHSVTRLLTTTWRVRWHDPHHLFRDGKAPPMILCLWHNRLALSLKISSFLRPRSSAQGVAAMISASKDGGLLAETLSYCGITGIRGSTSRRGRQALLELARMAERGYTLAITPDGPRGPTYQVQEGIIALAQITGLPILPIHINIGTKSAMPNWDKFQIPWPFSRVDIHFASLVSLPREATADERERCRAELQSCLQKFAD